MAGGLYGPHPVAVSGAGGVGSYMLEASVRPTHHYLYHYSYPRLSISAAATYLVDRHDALASWVATRHVQHCCGGRYNVTGGIRVSRKERSWPRTWLPSKPTDFQC